MNNFKCINNYTGWAVFAVAAVVYLLTLEPTTSFWDCGEFIASSYKLEVGHPPGNPIFQLLGRFFSMFADKESVALMVNAMSALCSAFTILFLFWTTTHLARRIMERGKETLSQGNIIAIMGAGTVAALAYTFSDTFWFSAVEAEVYAMSSLFTALVFWAMLKWEEEAEQKYANRWIVLIAYLMGLSIGVHLLNLLAIPAIALIYYFKKYKTTFWGIVKTLILSCVLLLFVMLLIPTIPRFAGFFDILFVNSFGMPFNSGAAFFMLLLFALFAWGLWITHKKGKVLLNTLVLCFTVFVIGFSSFAVVVIRSSANTPTNENQPDNAFALLYYLNREQYGSAPLISGQTFATPAVAYDPSYRYIRHNGKYIKNEGNPGLKYDSRYTMMFPRMYSPQADHVEHYKQYVSGRGKLIPQTENRMPTFRDNLSYFFDYQLGWMYWRYFMWNFAGRQNDIQGHGNSYYGNWESGISFIDNARLGNNTNEKPDLLKNNKANNHYYMLPLLLGLLGLFYQLSRDKRNFLIVGILFVLTGIAIVVYLNQTPFQPRERDYAYAGSFYAFTIWIGLGVLMLYELFRKKIPATIAAGLASALCLIVPIQMAAENWDDHDRSGRRIARDMAYNYLMSCEENAILFTIGDNDTFPLWYLQEVEEVRTDVRIVNLSLLGTDWYIDQMKYKVYDTPPVPFSLARDNYLLGTNDYVQIVERTSEPLPVKDVVNFIGSPRAEAKLASPYDGKKVAYVPTRNFRLPVNKENVLKTQLQERDDNFPKTMRMPDGTITFLDTALIPDFITFSIPKKSIKGGTKNEINKPEMMILDLLANNDWKRPIYFVSRGGDVVDLGFRDYLEYNGFTYKLVPFRGNPQDPHEMMNRDLMYDRLMNVYSWGNMNDPSLWIDWSNYQLVTLIMQCRNIFVQVAKSFNDVGDYEKAITLLDKMTEILPEKIFPYCMSIGQNELATLSILEEYYRAQQTEKANAIVESFLEETEKSLLFYFDVKSGGESEINTNLYCLQMLEHICTPYNEELATKVGVKFREYYSVLQAGGRL